MKRETQSFYQSLVQEAVERVLGGLDEAIDLEHAARRSVRAARDAWGRFMGQWLPQSGERCQNGDSYEIYLNNPTDVPKDELRTELYIPLV